MVDPDHAAEQFAAAAAAYCQAIEGAALPADALLAAAEAHLAGLYALALALPPAPEPPDAARRRVAGAELGPRVAALRAVLGGAARYWAVDDPLAEPPGPPVAGDLVEDLGDVYLLVGGGLRAWRAGGPGARAAAVWEWRFTFLAHWGATVATALPAIRARRDRAAAAGRSPAA